MQNPPSSTPPPASVSLFRLPHWVGYGLFVAVALALFFTAVHSYRQFVDDYQYNRPRYAAERALDLLAQNRTDEAAIEVQVLMRDRPIYTGLLNQEMSEVYEGPVFRNRVTTFERLTAALLDHDLLLEAEMVGWKALLEFHIASRALEMFVPWELMHAVKVLRDDWSSAFQISKLLAAHGVKNKVRLPNEIRPNPFPIDPAPFADLNRQMPDPLIQGLFDYYQSRLAPRPPEARNLRNRAAAQLANAEKATVIPGVQRQLQAFRHRILLEGDRRQEADALLAQTLGRDPSFMDEFWERWPWPSGQAPVNLLERDPTAMDMLWRGRVTTSTVTLPSFVDSFLLDERVSVLGVGGLERQELGYFNRENKLYPIVDGVEFSQNIAASLDFVSDRPVRRIFLAYEATPALGVYPILLLSINNDPYVPVYLDSPEPDLVAVDVDRPAGSYRLTLLYLNDASFVWSERNIHEDRNFKLYRIALVHVAPPE